MLIFGYSRKEYEHKVMGTCEEQTEYENYMNISLRGVRRALCFWEDPASSLFDKFLNIGMLTKTPPYNHIDIGRSRGIPDRTMFWC